MMFACRSADICWHRQQWSDTSRHCHRRRHWFTATSWSARRRHCITAPASSSVGRQSTLSPWQQHRLCVRPSHLSTSRYNGQSAGEPGPALTGHPVDSRWPFVSHLRHLNRDWPKLFVRDAAFWGKFVITRVHHLTGGSKTVYSVCLSSSLERPRSRHTDPLLLIYSFQFRSAFRATTMPSQLRPPETVACQPYPVNHTLPTADKAPTSFTDTLVVLIVV